MSSMELFTGEPSGRANLNGQPIEVYQTMDLPEDPTILEACTQHLSEGRGADLVGSFWMAGCDFPEPEEPQVIGFEISCPGASRFRKQCRLKLTQYDTDGNVLNTGNIS